jgi:hypothetical protein
LLTVRLHRDRRRGLVDSERLRSPTFQVQSDRIAGVRDALAAAHVDPESLTVVESCEHTLTSGGVAAEVFTFQVRWRSPVSTSSAKRDVAD